MQKKSRQKLMSGSLALAVALASTLTPVAAYAAPQTPETIVEKAMGRIAGADRYETAAKVSQTGWTQSDYAVLSAGMDDNLVDALTAAPLAKLKNAPILLTQGDVLNASAEAEIQRLGVKTVYVTSGSGVITQTVLAKLASLGLTVKPLGGADRFETAINIAKELPTPTEIAVSTAYSNADALSVASIAASKGMPILLTNVDGLPENVKTYLNTIRGGIQTSYVLGGTGVVSDGVKNTLPNAVRFGGADRFDTNREILNGFAKDIQNRSFYVANGDDAHLVDALAVSPLAGLSVTPVVLTGSQMPQESQEFVLLNLNIDNAIALGGETVVPQAIVDGFKTSVTFAQDNETKGSTDPLKPEQFDSVKITGNNVTLKNAKVAHSVYIQGDNAVLENVEVAGTVFVDPGKDGSADLNGVTANNIVVLSGGENSIHLVVKANYLKVESSSSVRVETKGDTQINNTVISSAAILDAVAGSVGKVEVQGTTTPDQVVEFRGKIGDVIVTGQVTVKAGVGAEITNLTIAAGNTEQVITLVGSFGTIQVDKASTINVGANTTIENMVTNAKAEVTLTDSSSVLKLITDKGNTDSVVKDSEGNVVNPGTGSIGGSGGSGGGGSSAPEFTALPGYLDLDESNQTITFTGPYTNLRTAKISVSENTEIEILADGTTSLGKWNLTAGENDAFTVTVLQKVNMTNIFDTLRASGVDIFTAVDFAGIINAVSGAGSNTAFYNELLPAVLTMVNGHEDALFSSINIIDIYNAASSLNDGTVGAIEASLQTAVEAYNDNYLGQPDKQISVQDLSGANGASAFNAALTKVDGSAFRDSFFKNVDFTALFTAIQGKQSVYNAINFGNIFDALQTCAQSDPAVYTKAADVYQIILNLSLDANSIDAVRDAADFTGILAQIDEQHAVTINLTTGGQTTTYDALFQ